MFVTTKRVDCMIEVIVCFIISLCLFGVSGELFFLRREERKVTTG